MEQSNMKGIMSLIFGGIFTCYPIPNLWNVYISSSENSKMQICNTNYKSENGKAGVFLT